MCLTVCKFNYSLSRVPDGIKMSVLLCVGQCECFGFELCVEQYRDCIFFVLYLSTV